MLTKHSMKLKIFEMVFLNKNHTWFSCQPRAPWILIWLPDITVLWRFILTSIPLPWQVIHHLCCQLMPCWAVYLLDADQCHHLGLPSVEAGSSRCCCCSSLGCAAAEPAAGPHLSAEHPPSESHTERGDHSVQWLSDWGHRHLLLRTWMMRMSYD